MNDFKKNDKYRTPWTPEEIEFVKKNYGYMMTSLFAEKLGRTENSIQWVIRGLNIPLTEKYRAWTQVEKKIISTYYPRPGGIELVASLLPWRTRGAIFRMIDKLGITRVKKWKEQERQILEQYYPIEGIAVNDRLAGRTVHAVRGMARQPGIKPADGSTSQQKGTQEEWQRLNENKQLPLTKLAELFPERTQCSVLKALGCVRKEQDAEKKLSQK